MVGSKWLLGVGLGNYLINYARFAVPGTPPFPTLPHNFYVLLWAEGGILSLLGFGWLFGSCIWSTWKAQGWVARDARLTVRGFAASFVAMAIEAGLSNDLNLLITWTLLGMGAALVHATRTPEPACA